MLNRSLLAAASGGTGAIANFLFLVVAGFIGLPALLGLGLPSFASSAFLYKQVFWGALWGAVLLQLPFMPKQWVKRAIIIAVIPALATFFIFFPLGTSDGKGPGIAGLNIGLLMPVYVLMADLAFGLVTSKLFSLVDKEQ